MKWMKFDFYFQQSYVRHESGIWFALQNAPIGEMSKCLFCCCAVCIISVFGRWARPGRTTDAVGGEIDADATDGSVGLGKVREAGDYSHKLQEEWSESQNCSNSQGCINCSGYTAQSILMHYFSNNFLLCFISMCHIHGKLERLWKCIHF